ncbi:MAG: MMPL family transporter [Erysipelotrichaceae bacterium]|jgi:predicted RND superfamily exporter protein|nr:MMPL family transporter [Erysipelotrichaceae bacterium]
MNKIATMIFKSKYVLFGIILSLFAVMFAACFYVGTNYDMSKYLSENSATRIAMEEMNESFGEITILELAFEDQDTLNKYKPEIKELDGVILALHENTSEYVQDNKYLLRVFISHGIYSSEAAKLVRAIHQMLQSDPYYLASTTTSFTFLQDATNRDVVYIILIASAVLLVILFLTSSSWIDPLILALALFIGIIINLGSNIFLGEISFVTRAICIVMQFALSLDFSIVFLNRFKEERSTTNDKKTAIVKTLRVTIVPLGIAALTTIVGLVALMFMEFKLGFDIGLVLAKGVIISLLTTFLFMPALLSLFDKAILKTKKKTLRSRIFHSDLKNTDIKLTAFTKFQTKSAIIIPFLLVGVTATCLLITPKINDAYQTTTSKNPTAKVVSDAKVIENTFGYTNSFIVVFNRNDEVETEIVTWLRTYEINRQPSFNRIESIVDRKLEVPMTAEEMSEYIKTYLNLEQRFNEIIAGSPLQFLIPDGLVSELVTVGTTAMVSYVYREVAPQNGTMTVLETLDYLANESAADATIAVMMDRIKEILNTYLPYDVSPYLDSLEINERIKVALNELNYSAQTAMTLLRSSDGKARVIANLNLAPSNGKAFEITRELRMVLMTLDDDVHIVSESLILADIEEVFSQDLLLINLITIIGIFIFVLIAFRNPVFPLILVALLQASSIIANCIVSFSFPPMFFITHILVMCIMMGACDDFAILFADYYKEERTQYEKKLSLQNATKKSLPSILTSAAVLILSALIVAFATEVQVIADIGLMLAIECGIAILLIIFVLPQMIYLFDKWLLFDPIAAIKMRRNSVTPPQK